MSIVYDVLLLPLLRYTGGELKIEFVELIHYIQKLNSNKTKGQKHNKLMHSGVQNCAKSSGSDFESFIFSERQSIYKTLIPVLYIPTPYFVCVFRQWQSINVKQYYTKWRH